MRAILNAYKSLSPDIFDILNQGAGQWNGPNEQAFIYRAYPTTRNVAVDVAIMEKAPNVYTIPSEFGWSDLGTWASLHAETPKDEFGNTLLGGDALVVDTSN